MAALSPLLAILVTCGPPLTEPSSQNISGHWISPDRIGPIYDISMDVSQTEDGDVSGEWAGKASPTDAACPEGLGTNPSGRVSGTNKALGLNLAVVGAGDFQGQMISPTALRGSLFSCGVFYPITFSAVIAASGG